MRGQGIIERAFGLAGSGRFQDMRDLERALSSEGFTDVSQYLSGPSLRAQLKKLMSGKPAGRPKAAVVLAGTADPSKTKEAPPKLKGAPPLLGEG
ncbi:MAG TPA: hypothetical protein VF650_04610 [Allosphingosinicella sp.]